MGISDGDGGYMGSYDTSYTTGDDAFADIHNLDHCIKYLNQSLATFGFPSGLNFYSTEPTAIVRTCNCIYAMIQQRQRDIEYRETANDTRQRLMSDMSRLEAKVERLTDQMSSKERELQALTSKEQKAAAANRAQLERLQHEKDEFQRMVISTQQVRIQQMHELKKKEKEYIKLQERLNQVLMEKKKESKTGIEIMNLLQKEGRQRGTWNSKKADGDFYKMIVDAYEAKKQELLAENTDLRALLRSMQGDMRDFLNTPSGLTRPGTSASTHELEPPATPLGGRTDVFDLPFHMARDQIEQSLRAKMSSIKERMMQVQESQKGLQLTRETSEREQVLEAQLVEARSIISEQATLMNKHMPGEDDSRSVITEQQEADSRYSPAEEDRVTFELLKRHMEVTRPTMKEMALGLAKECIAVEEARRRLEEEQASRASKVKPVEQSRSAKNQSEGFLEIIPPLYPVPSPESAPTTIQYAWVEDMAINFENLTTRPETPDYPSPHETWQENEITWTETQNSIPTSSFQHPWLELDHLKKFTAPSKPYNLWQANEGAQLNIKLETYNNVIEKDQVAPPQDHNKWPTSQISQPVTEIVWTDKDLWSQCPHAPDAAEVPPMWQGTDACPSELYISLPISHDSQIWDAHESPGGAPEVHTPKCFKSLPKSYDSGVRNVDECPPSWPGTHTPQSEVYTSLSESHDYWPECQTPPVITESDQGDYTESGNLQSSLLEVEPGTNWPKCQIPPLMTDSGECSYHNLESSLDFVLEVEVAAPQTPEIGSDRVSDCDEQVVGVENSSDMRWHSPKRPRCEIHVPGTENVPGWSASEESQYDSPECEPDLANSYSKKHSTTFLCADKLWFLSKFPEKKNISVGRGPLVESPGVVEDFYQRGKDPKNGTNQGSGRPQRVPLVSTTGFQ